jgi:hypothetical protein
MNWFSRRNLIIGLAVLMPVIEGCSYIGPSSLNIERRRYNDVVQKTNDEELLLNLVRMRYNDNPSFMSVSSITSSLSLSTSASPTYSRTDNSLGIAIASITKSITPSLTVSDSPTISYAPLQGDSYVRDLLTPVTPKLIALLSSSGWPLSVALKLCFTQINDVLNAPSASRPSPAMAPDFEQFEELIVNLQKMGTGVQLGYAVIDKKVHSSLRFSPGMLETPAGKNVVRILKLAQGINKFKLSANDWFEKKGVINVQTRSVLGTLYMLSHNIAIPAEHIDKGWVGKTVTADGKDFDWNLLSKGLFKVSVNSIRPKYTDVAVKYRGHWFSIARNDLKTKKTFTMMSQLLSLQSGSYVNNSKAPVLTIGVD